MIILEISHFLFKDIINLGGLYFLEIYFRHLLELSALDSLFFQILLNRHLSC